MFSKFSVWVIIKGQLRTMKVYGTDKLDFFEVCVLFFIPLASPILQIFMDLHLSKDIVGTIVSAASIFAGLLLNLLVLLYSILSAILKPNPVKTPCVDDERIKDLIEHLFYNISFAILVSILIVVASLIHLTGMKWIMTGSDIFVSYFGIQLFLLITQILKRFHKLLEHQMSRTRQKKQQEASVIWGKTKQQDPRC